MSQKTAKNIRLIYGVVLSLLLVVTGVLLMVSCVSVYNIGQRPFTVENISAAFAKIQIPVYITIGAVLIGIVLKIALPGEKIKVKAIIEKRSILSRLEKKLVGRETDEGYAKRTRKEKLVRIIARIINFIICARLLSIALIYTLNFENYTADYNASVIAACVWVLSCSLVAIGTSTALLYIESASYSRQIEAVKEAIKSAKPAEKSEPVENVDASAKEKISGRIALAVRLTILAVAIVFIVLGVFNGGMADVLGKAIRICTECIGLG